MKGNENMIIEYSSEYYPDKLRKLEKPPTRLYAEGNIEILKDFGIAVIGSRTNTQYGEEMCQKFTQELVRYNITVISGLAIGIDSIAHKTSLKNCGKTIAVLPSGLKNIYPNENINLYKEIIKNDGVIVSEYENNVKATSKNFLERNRIVAGLGAGTLVIEAGYRSGTTVTARYTKQQGKPIFCIPSSLQNIKGKSTNELIKNGAKLITDIKDILKTYPNMKFVKKEICKKDIIIDIPPNLIEVYQILNEKPQNINEISGKLNKPISEVSYKLMMLQLEDKITEIPGQNFVRKI